MSSFPTPQMYASDNPDMMSDQQLAAVVRQEWHKKQAEDQLPNSAGDMVVKGEDDIGKLRYSWKNVEVLATPRAKRESLPEKKTARRRRQRPGSPRLNVR